MISCKGCPFIVYVFAKAESIYYSEGYFECIIDYEIKTPSPIAGCAPNFKKATSKDCKLTAVTYALKNERESINFVPKEIDG